MFLLIPYNDEPNFSFIFQGLDYILIGKSGLDDVNDDLEEEDEDSDDEISNESDDCNVESSQDK